MGRHIIELSNREITEIIKLYTDSALPTKEIAQMYGISDGTLSRLIGNSGVARRNPGQVGKKKRKSDNNYKVCRKCGAKNSKESNFCNMCGTALLNDKQIILQKLEKLTDYFVVLQHANRDKYIKEVNDIIGMVEKLDVRVSDFDER